MFILLVVSSGVHAQITDPDFQNCGTNANDLFKQIPSTNVEMFVCPNELHPDITVCDNSTIKYLIYLRSNNETASEFVKIDVLQTIGDKDKMDFFNGFGTFDVFPSMTLAGGTDDTGNVGIEVPKLEINAAGERTYIKLAIEFKWTPKGLQLNSGTIQHIFYAKKVTEDKYYEMHKCEPVVVNFLKAGNLVGYPKLSESVGSFPKPFSQQDLDCNILHSKRLKINGTFEFDISYCFGEQSIIFMQDDAKIAVKSGVKLSLDNTQVIQCGSGRWNSIEVESGGTLIIKNNSSIEGGKIAVKAKAGSTVEVDESLFVDNNIAIDADEGANIIITQNQFLKSADIGVQFNGLIKINAFSGNYFESPNGNANVKSNGSIVASTKNTFAACKVGILANKSTIFSKDDVFKNQIFGISSKATSTEIANVTVTGGSFDKCATAMEMQGSGLNCTASNVSNSTYGVLHSGNCDIIAVQNTNFQLVSKGVTLRLSKANKILLDDNKLYSGDVGIQLLLAQSKANVSIRRNQLSEYDKGIYLRHDGLSKTVCDVRKNYVSSRSYGILNQSGNNGTVSNNTLVLASGTGIQLNGGSGYILNCNNVGNGDKGIVTNMSTKPIVVCNTTAGALEGVIFDGTSTGTQVKGNTMRNAVGLLLKESAVIGVQQYAGNRWQQGSTAICKNPNYDISGFLVTNNIQDPALKPIQDEFLPVYHDPSKWFTNTPPPPETSTYICNAGNNCDSYLAPPGILNCDNVLDDQIRNNEFMDERFGEVSSWIAKSQLYERLRSDTDCVNGEVQTFLDGLENQSIGHFETLKQNYQLIDNVIATDNLEEQLESLNQEYGNLTSTMIQTTDESVLNSLKVQLAATRIAIQALNSQLESSKVENNNAQNVALDVLASSNDAANYNTEYENDNQLINRIWFTTLARGAELSDEQLSIVYNIANQCPFAAGEVVYRARNIYALSNPNAQFRDNSLCPASARNGKDAFAKLSGITLYPNPASEEVTLSYEKLPANCTFTLLNSLGQPVASFKLDTEGKATIELDRFPAGLYLAQILDHNQVLYSEKLPIQQ